MVKSPMQWPMTDRENPLPGAALAESQSVDVSVIIVNWNTCGLLRDCLTSLRAQSGRLTTQVVVVDNASSDDSVAMVRSEFPEVTLIASPVNLGFAAANNVGLRIAEGRYWLLLNPDTIVLDDCLEKCLEYADRHTDIGVLGCQVLEAHDRLQKTCFRFPTPWYTFLWCLGIGRLLKRFPVVESEELSGWDRCTERDVDVVSGMFMLVRREAAEQVGPLDEAFFVYGEEVDWCFRFARAGWRCTFAPVGRIVHRDGGGQSTKLASVKMFVQQVKSRMIFFSKNRGWVAAASARVLMCCGYAARFLALRTLGWIRRDAALRHKSVCAGAACVFLLTGRSPR